MNCHFSSHVSEVANHWHIFTFWPHKYACKLNNVIKHVFKLSKKKVFATRPYFPLWSQLTSQQFSFLKWDLFRDLLTSDDEIPDQDCSVKGYFSSHQTFGIKMKQDNKGKLAMNWLEQILLVLSAIWEEEVLKISQCFSVLRLCVELMSKTDTYRACRLYIALFEA